MQQHINKKTTKIALFVRFSCAVCIDALFSRLLVNMTAVRMRQHTPR